MALALAAPAARAQAPDDRLLASIDGVELAQQAPGAPLSDGIGAGAQVTPGEPIAEDLRVLAQAAQVPGDEPPLTEEPPVPLATPEPAPEPTATATATAEPTATASPGADDRERLPDTGSDAGLLALAGLSLLGMGVSLRWAAPGAAD